MKSQVRVAVIGGGVVGCSVLYHLTRLGWSEVMLLERDELTCGSSWHAAGGMHTLNSDPNVAKLQDYTIRLYRELEQVSGQSCGIHLTGGIMLAGTETRLDFLKTANARHKVLGLESEFISIEEARRRDRQLRQARGDRARRRGQSPGAATATAAPGPLKVRVARREG